MAGPICSVCSSQAPYAHDTVHGPVALGLGAPVTNMQAPHNATKEHNHYSSTRKHSRSYHWFV